jgi:hypothetical protein
MGCPKDQCQCPRNVPNAREINSSSTPENTRRVRRAHHVAGGAHGAPYSGSLQLSLFNPVLLASAIASLRSATCNFEMMLET